MRKIAKYVALGVAALVVVVMWYKFGFGAWAGAMLALAAFAIYAAIDKQEELEELESEAWEEFMGDLDTVMREMEHNDWVKKGTVVERSEGDAEGDA